MSLTLLCVSCIVGYSFVTIEVLHEDADEYMDDHKKETSTQLRSGEVLSLKKINKETINNGRYSVLKVYCMSYLS